MSAWLNTVKSVLGFPSVASSAPFIACEFRSDEQLGLMINETSGQMVVTYIIPDGQADKRNKKIIQYKRDHFSKYIIQPGDILFSKNGILVNTVKEMKQVKTYTSPEKTFEILLQRPNTSSYPLVTTAPSTFAAGDNGIIKKEVLLGHRLRFEVLYEHPNSGADTLLPVFEGNGEGIFVQSRWNYIPVKGRGDCFSVRVTDLAAPTYLYTETGTSPTQPLAPDTVVYFLPTEVSEVYVHGTIQNQQENDTYDIRRTPNHDITYGIPTERISMVRVGAHYSGTSVLCNIYCDGKLVHRSPSFTNNTRTKLIRGIQRQGKLWKMSFSVSDFKASSSGSAMNAVFEVQKKGCINIKCSTYTSFCPPKTQLSKNQQLNNAKLIPIPTMATLQETAATRKIKVSTNYTPTHMPTQIKSSKFQFTASNKICNAEANIRYRGAGVLEGVGIIQDTSKKRSRPSSSSSSSSSSNNDGIEIVEQKKEAPIVIELLSDDDEEPLSKQEPSKKKVKTEHHKDVKVKVEKDGVIDLC